MTLTDEHGVEWAILGVPSDFCGTMYAELEAADGSRTVRLAGQLRAAGYDVPERVLAEVGHRPIREGACVEWSGGVIDRDVPLEDDPDLYEVEPGVYAFQGHE